jgi:hypothetical protein
MPERESPISLVREFIETSIKVSILRVQWAFWCKAWGSGIHIP